jgi:hypothetical protein
VPRGVSKCPSCGEPVSPFAAGCAICGADLEAARARQASKRQLELPGLPAFGGSGGIDWAQLAIALILAVALSPLGLLLSLYWAFRHYRYGETTMVALMAVMCVIAVAAILDPFWFGSHLGA